MPSVNDKQSSAQTSGRSQGNGAAHPVPRKADQDPLFRNDSFGNLKKGKVPYGAGQTYADPSPDREEFLRRTEGLTAMQRHCVYFDGSLQGIVTPLDTFHGFYALGFGLILSFIAVVVVHSGFSYPSLPNDGTWKAWLPDPFFRIWIANISRNKHGSDSESYDRRGHFQEHKLSEALETFSSHPNRDRLSLSDAWAMGKARRNVMDPFGWGAEAFEWGSTYMLLWPADGYMKKDDIIGIIDGSIFPVLAHQRRQKGAFKAK
ncbi:unnamed protein product [Parajaminaea phylloscopi]